MSKLLTGESLVNTSASVSVEAIKASLNDGVIKEFEKKVDNLLTLGLTAKETNAGSLIKNPLILKTLDEMGKLVSKRFGINITFKLTDEYDIYSMPVTPMTNSAINMFSTDTLKMIKAMFNYKGANLKEVNAEASSPIVDANNIRSHMLKLLDNAMKFEKALHAKGVVVDRDKVVMYNVPSDVGSIIVFNLEIPLAYNLTADEFTGILLHEVGHIWTSIEYLYRRTITLSAVTEAIQDSMRDSRSPRETICFIAEKTGDTKLASELKDKNLITCLTEVAPIFAGDDLYATKDEEHLADQFSARFGYGAALVSAIAKIHGTEVSNEAYSLSTNKKGEYIVRDGDVIYGKYKHFNDIPFFIRINFILAVLFAAVLCIVLAISLASAGVLIASILSVFFAPFIVMFMIYKFFKFLGSIFGKSEFTKAGGEIAKRASDTSIKTGMNSIKTIKTMYGVKRFTYSEFDEYEEHDNPYDRTVRMKQELVRMIRTSDLPRSETSMLLDQIGTIEALLDIVPKDKLSIIDKFFLLVSKSKRNHRDIEALDKQIEALMENDLHILKNKIDLIRGK